MEQCIYNKIRFLQETETLAPQHFHGALDLVSLNVHKEQWRKPEALLKL